MRPKTSTVAYLLTALGILGIMISLITEQSDYDPVAFGIATVSILVAIIGISLAFRVPHDEQAGQRTTRTGVLELCSLASASQRLYYV
jgi:hypothetical protein